MKDLAAAGAFPNAMIGVTTVQSLAGIGISVVPSPGAGFHATVQVPNPLPPNLATMISAVHSTTKSRPQAKIRPPMPLPRIYIDINNKDELHRVRLNLPRSKIDLDRASEVLRPGIHVILYMEGEFEFEAVLDWDARHSSWVASPIYSTIKYYD